MNRRQHFSADPSDREGVEDRTLMRDPLAGREFAHLEASVAQDEEGEEDLDTAYEQAATRLEAAEAEVARWKAAASSAEAPTRSATARGSPN